MIIFYFHFKVGKGQNNIGIEKGSDCILVRQLKKYWRTPINLLRNVNFE